MTSEDITYLFALLITGKILSNEIVVANNINHFKLIDKFLLTAPIRSGMRQYKTANVFLYAQHVIVRYI